MAVISETSAHVHIKQAIMSAVPSQQLEAMTGTDAHTKKRVKRDRGQNSPDTMVNDDSVDDSALHAVEGGWSPALEALAGMRSEQQHDAGENGNDGEDIVKSIQYSTTGDLYLKVRVHGVGVVAYHVSAALVSFAMPELYSKIAAASTAGSQIVSLMDPDDRAFGLDTLMCITHYQFHHLPDSLTLAQLYDLAMVADKYKCIQLLYPNMKRWIAQQDWPALVGASHGAHERALFIAWTFGVGREFTQLLYKVAAVTSLRDDGLLVNEQGLPWTDTTLPLDVIALIRDVRLQIIQRVITTLRQPVFDIMSGEVDGRPPYCHCLDTSMNSVCESLMLGSAIRGLIQAKLWPFPKATKFEGTAASLAEKLAAIKVERFKAPRVLPHLDDHVLCSTGHNEALVQVLSGAASLPVSAVAHLKMQAAQAGGLEEEDFRHVACTGAAADVNALVDPFLNEFYAGGRASAVPATAREIMMEDGIKHEEVDEDDGKLDHFELFAAQMEGSPDRESTGSTEIKEEESD